MNVHTYIEKIAVRKSVKDYVMKNPELRKLIVPGKVDKAFSSLANRKNMKIPEGIREGSKNLKRLQYSPYDVDDIVSRDVQSGLLSKRDADSVRSFLGGRNQSLNQARLSKNLQAKVRVDRPLEPRSGNRAMDVGIGRDSYISINPKKKTVFDRNLPAPEIASTPGKGSVPLKKGDEESLSRLFEQRKSYSGNKDLIDPTFDPSSSVSSVLENMDRFAKQKGFVPRQMPKKPKVLRFADYKKSKN